MACIKVGSSFPPTHFHVIIPLSRISLFLNSTFLLFIASPLLGLIHVNSGGVKSYWSPDTNAGLVLFPARSLPTNVIV